MKKTVWSLALTLAFVVWTAGCDLFNPTSNGTVEVNNTVTNFGSCSIWANIDGNQTVTLGMPQLYQFQPVPPGTHTVNMGLPPGGCGGSSSCDFQNTGNSSYSNTFQVKGGNLYVLEVSAGGSCNIFNVTGP